MHSPAPSRAALLGASATSGMQALLAQALPMPGSPPNTPTAETAALLRQKQLQEDANSLGERIMAQVRVGPFQTRMNRFTLLLFPARSCTVGTLTSHSSCVQSCAS